MHEHVGGFAALVLGIPALLAAGLYCGGVLRTLRRGRRSPLQRTAAWLAGVAVGLAAVVGPVADLSHHDFVAHMAVHLMVGMLAPLLLVLGAPVTLALRALDVAAARRLSRLFRAGPSRSSCIRLLPRR